MSADESSWWARGAMYDVGQSAPGGSPLIGVERRRFPPRQGVSWRGEPRRFESQLALGHWTRSTTQNYTSDTVNDRTCTSMIEERTCEYIMWCQPNGHDTVWLIMSTLMDKSLEWFDNACTGWNTRHKLLMCYIHTIHVIWGCCRRQTYISGVR